MTIDTSFEMGILTVKLVRYSQYLQKYENYTIIPFVYEQARIYYEKQANKADQITKSIQKQLEQDRIEIKYNPNDYFGRKKKKIIDLNSIQED